MFTFPPFGFGFGSFFWGYFFVRQLSVQLSTKKFLDQDRFVSISHTNQPWQLPCHTHPHIAPITPSLYSTTKQVKTCQENAVGQSAIRNPHISAVHYHTTTQWYAVQQESWSVYGRLWHIDLLSRPPSGSWWSSNRPRSLSSWRWRGTWKQLLPTNAWIFKDVWWIDHNLHPTPSYGWWLMLMRFPRTKNLNPILHCRYYYPSKMWLIRTLV